VEKTIGRRYTYVRAEDRAAEQAIQEFKVKKRRLHRKHGSKRL
jgi:hypothetical protein